MMQKKDAMPIQNSDISRIEFRQEQRLAKVIINHSDRKNAITKSMREDLISTYKKWVAEPEIYAITIEAQEPTIFSSGADLVEIHEAYLQSKADAVALFRQEYETMWSIECYTKPLITMINGAVMGGGVGLIQFGTHIVAGENFSWSMPEVKMGLFPDIGITYLLAKMPSNIGLYLALTGRSITRQDGLYLGLLEHCIDSQHFEQIQSQLAQADPIDPLLDNLHRSSNANQSIEKSEVAQKAALIEQIFSHPTIETILEALKAQDDEHESWAKEVIADLQSAAPISLKVTLEAMKRAKNLKLEEALEQDYILAQHFLSANDFIGSIKARLFEKTTPVWMPATLEEVSESMVAGYFDENESEKLALPPRELGVDK